VSARFGIREAVEGDAVGIARTHIASWQSSYRGILPEHVLDGLDLRRRTETRKGILRAAAGCHLVAYDLSHGDIVGFCDAGPHRRASPAATGEIYALYLEHHAKRHGLGGELLTRARAWLAARGMASMAIWVLEANHHARRFYEAMGGALAGRIHTRVYGVPVVEVAYAWPPS